MGKGVGSANPRGGHAGCGAQGQLREQDANRCGYHAAGASPGPSVARIWAAWTLGGGAKDK